MFNRRLIVVDNYQQNRGVVKKSSIYLKTSNQITIFLVFDLFFLKSPKLNSVKSNNISYFGLTSAFVSFFISTIFLLFLLLF